MTAPWIPIAAIFQIVFCGLILIGFLSWLFLIIIPIRENLPDPRYWLDPILYTISQPIGAVVAIVGAYLLLTKRALGLYVSMASVPILLIIRWGQFMFGGLIWALILPSFFTHNVQSAPDVQLTQSQISFEIFVWPTIYNSCIAAIAALLAICWKAERIRSNAEARRFIVSARALLADIFSRCKL